MSASPLQHPNLVNPVLAVGDRAPAFTLPDSRGERIRLTEYRGLWVVLTFGTRANSASCVRLLKEFNRRQKTFDSLQATVVGIRPKTSLNGQTVAAESSFVCVVSDQDHKIAERYGIWRKKNDHGRQYHGYVRSCILVDPSGRVAHIFDNVRIPGLVNRVLDVLRQEIIS